MRLPTQQIDDWLGEISDDDWNEGAGERPAGRHQGSHADLTVPAGHDPHGEWADATSRPNSSIDATAARREAVHRRRLFAGLVLATALVVATGIAVVIFRGGDGAPTTTLAEPVTSSPEQTGTEASPTPTRTSPTDTADTPAATSSSEEPTTPKATSTISFTLPTGTKLRLGEDADPAVVTDLQQALKAAGYDPGSIDGRYGQKTVQAVMAFQRASGLPADGVVGAATAAALNRAPGADAATSSFDLPEGTKLRLGEDADPAVVTDLQQALKVAGYDPGSIDGRYGQKTVQAVMAFQRASGLPADGVVGAATAAELNDAAPTG